MKKNLIAKMEAGLLLLTILAVDPSPGYAWNSFKAMAKALSKEAARAGVEKIGILPFVPTNGANSREGVSISERLVTHIVQHGKVQVVERGLLKKIMQEHYLGNTGLLSPEGRKKAGKILPVDAIVTGSFVNLGGKVKVNARLIHIESGTILFADNREVKNDWMDVWRNVPVPDLFVEAPPLKTSPRRAWQRPPEMLKAVVLETGLDCTDANRRVNLLERSILDQKARFWAMRLRDDSFSFASLKFNPGSTITDPKLRSRFYALVKYWYRQDKIPSLTPEEVETFIALDGKAFALYRECAL